MSGGNLSIQSYFQRSSSPHHRNEQSSVTDVEEPLEFGPHSPWTPTKEYAEVDIGNLEPGPKCISLTGRIVNLYQLSRQSEAPLAAKGCLKLIVKDDSGALTVRLWYADVDYSSLRLGQLASIWTPHVSNCNSDLSTASAPLFTSIFPERDSSCHFLLHDQSDNALLCKTPLGYTEGQPLEGLVTLRCLTEDGHDPACGRILVCVKSIGPKKRVTNKSGILNTVVNICIFDDTAEATLTLWNAVSASASSWQPSHTVLLISNPGYRNDRRLQISITANTQVEVDPYIVDTDWLRKFAQQLKKTANVNPPFPDGVFDTEAALTSEIRVLYRLADIDEFVRGNPEETFMGFLSVLIMEMNLVSLLQRGMLMCTMCCGVPHYANTTTSTCKQCGSEIVLRINPRVLGAIIDETGTVSGGKLILSCHAWERLLGRTAEELTNAGIDVLRYVEDILLYSRVTLAFGWAPEHRGTAARIVIWGVFP